MMRRIPTLLALAAFIAGCIPNDSPPAQPTTVSTQAPLLETPSPAENSAVVIRFAASVAYKSLYGRDIKTFNEQNPNIEVQFVATEDAIPDTGTFDWDLNQRQMMSIADTAVGSTLREGFITKGYFRNLKPFIDADASFDRTDFYPAAFAGSTYQGGIYAVPHTITVPLMAYNKNLWAKKGLPPPSPDWQWANLLDAAARLAKRQNGTTSVYGFLDATGGYNTFNSTLIAQGLGDLFRTPPERVQLDKPAIVAVLGQVATLAGGGALYLNPQPDTDSIRIDSDALQPLMLQQRVALWEAGDLDMQNGPPPFPVGFAPYPPLPRGSAQLNTLGYLMSNGTRHPQEAWRWLSFLSHQMPTRPNDGFYEVPARISVANKSGYWDKLDAETRAAVETTLRRPGSPPIPEYVPNLKYTGRALQRAVHAALQGTTSPAQALADAQLWLQQQLAQAKLTPQPTQDTRPIAVHTPAPVGVATPVPPTPIGATKISFGTILDEQDAGWNTVAFTVGGYTDKHSDFIPVLTSTYTPGGPSGIVGAAIMDCFLWPATPQASDTSALLDLTPLIAADPDFSLDDYIPALLAPFQHNGKLYGLPYTVSFRVLGYNPGLLRTAGLTPPNAAWTLDDVLNAAKALTGGTGANQRYGFASIGSQTRDVFFFLNQLGATATTGSGAELAPQYTDARVVRALQLYVDLLRTASPQQQLNGYQRGSWSNAAGDLVANNKVGLWFTNQPRGASSTNSDSGAVSYQIDTSNAIAPPPLATGPVAAGDVQVASGLYISATSKHPQECWQLLKYLTAQFSPFGDGFPARRSLAERDVPTGMAKVYDAYAAAFARTPDPASVLAPTTQSPIDFYWLFRAVDRALGGADLAKELADAQLTTDQFLACVRGGEAGSVCATQVDPDYYGWKNVP